MSLVFFKYNSNNKLFKREFMEIIQTTDAFKALIEDIKSTTDGYRDPLAFGICRVDLGQLNVDKTLQATYRPTNGLLVDILYSYVHVVSNYQSLTTFGT